MDTLGSRLKHLREENGFTLEYVATSLNTTKTSIARYEKNDREPKSEMISALADFYNVSTDYLLGRQSDLDIESEDTYSEDVLEAAELFGELSETQKEVILKLIEEFLENKK